MRILVFSEVFWPEDFLVNDLVEAWRIMGHDVEVVTQYPSYPQGHVFAGYENKSFATENWNGVKIHRYPFVEGYRESKWKKIRNYHSFVQGGKDVVDSLENDYDCIFISQTGPLTVALPALYAKKRWGTPVNIWTCDIWPDAVYGYGIPENAVTSALINRFIKKVYCSCDRIYISSQRFEENIGVYTHTDCVYAPNWLRPVDNVSSSLRLDKKLFHFTFTGNVSRYQNLINTIDGFCKAGIMNAQLNIIGDGSYLEIVKSHALKTGASNVVFHGRRPYNEMADILSQSDVLVLPLMPNKGIQKTEPFKIQSYLQAKKPIFGILNGAGRDIIEENELGICANPDDVDSIANGFLTMLNYGDGHMAELSRSAELLMSNRFNKNKIVERITSNLIVR